LTRRGGVAEAVLGSAFTFQVLFVDGNNDPMAVNNPTIDVFMFSQTGVKQYLVTAQTMNAVTPVEVGRYTYVYTIPTTLDDGDLLYAEVTAEDPGTGELLRANQEVTAISANRGLGASVGMTARFF
jgi:hypothetical protein